MRKLILCFPQPKSHPPHGKEPKAHCKYTESIRRPQCLSPSIYGAYFPFAERQSGKTKPQPDYAKPDTLLPPLQKTVYGRTDKVFSTIACKNEYHLRLTGKRSGLGEV
jgi:hypothetical protein